MLHKLLFQLLLSICLFKINIHVESREKNKYGLHRCYLCFIVFNVLYFYIFLKNYIFKFFKEAFFKIRVYRD